MGGIITINEAALIYVIVNKSRPVEEAVDYAITLFELRKQRVKKVRARILTREDVAMIVSLYMEGYTTSEIAREIGCSQGCVSKRIKKERNKKL